MKLENYYDVVVVGAGPGGSITARDCAKAGLSVLLLEKRPEIGAPKRCAEGVALKLIQKLGYSGKENFVAQRTNKGAFFSPNGKKLEAPMEEGCVLERKVFDKFLAYDAAAAGAKVIARAEVTDVIKEKGKAVGVVVDYGGEKADVKAKVIVAADGVESKVARMAGLNIYSDSKNIVSAHQYEMAGIEIESPEKVYLYVGRNIAPGGYIWIFPKGSHIANVGIGTFPGNNGKTAKHCLDKWIDSMPSIRKGSIIEENAGGVPVGAFLKKMTADNFLLVGDAAHQVNPITGGGVAEATFAGQLAAKVIVRAIKEGDTSEKNLDEYNKMWWEERGNHLAKLERVMRVGISLSDDDFNGVMGALDDDGLLRVLKGDVAFIMKLLVRYPRLLALAAKLI